MGEVIEIATPEEQAYRRLREIHDKLVQAVMVTVDVMDDLQAGRERIRVPRLRHACADTFRETKAGLEWALLTLQGHEVTEQEIAEFLVANPDCVAVTIEGDE